MDNNSKYISNKTLLVIIGICIFLAFISVTPLVFADGDTDDAIHSDITSTESSDSVDEDISTDTNIDSEGTTEADTETDADSNELDVDADNSQLDIDNNSDAKSELLAAESDSKIICNVYYDDNEQNFDPYTSVQDAVDNINNGKRLYGDPIPDDADVVLTFKESVELDSSITVKKPMRFSAFKNAEITKSSSLKDPLFIIDCKGADKKKIVQFRNIVVRGNKDASNNSSLIEVKGGSKLTLQEGCVLKDNNAYCGGAVLARKHSEVVMQKKSVIENCSASSGGAIYAEESCEVSCENCEIKSNTALDNGGAIFLSRDSKLLLKSARIMDNNINFVAEKLERGRAIYGFECSIKTEDSVKKPCVIANSAEDTGSNIQYPSAIYLHNTKDVSFSNTEIYNFKARNGAAIQAFAEDGKKCSINIKDCKIRDCEANNGGAIYLGSESKISHNKNIEANLSGKTTITNCAALCGGGVILKNNSTFSMTDEAKITDCVAKGNSGNYKGLGGAIDIQYGSVELSGSSSISNCKAISTGDITGNEAMGGAISLARKDWISGAKSPYAKLVLKDNFKITDCSAAYGGAISQQDNSSVKLTGPVEISGCKALCDGGVVCGVGGTFSMESSEADAPKISGNSAEGKGGAIYSGGVAGEEYRVTLNAGAITSNTAGENGGGVCVYGYGTYNNKVSLGHSIQITDNKANGKDNNLEVMKRDGPLPVLDIVEPNEGDLLKVGITGYEKNGTGFCSNLVGGRFADISNVMYYDGNKKEYKSSWKKHIYSDVDASLEPYCDYSFDHNYWKWGLTSYIVIKNNVEGDFANPDDVFEYTISDYGDMLIKNKDELKDELGDSIQFNDNKISFKLKDGEEIKLSVFNYQTGPKFTVTQAKYDGYTSTNKLDNVTSQEPLVCKVSQADGKCENHTLVFNNRYKNIPITAVDTGSDAVFDVFKGVVGILVGFGLSSAAIRLRRYRKTI